MDYPKLEDVGGIHQSMNGCPWLSGCFGRFLFPPALQQLRRGETSTVHPGLKRDVVCEAFRALVSHPSLERFYLSNSAARR